MVAAAGQASQLSESKFGGRELRNTPLGGGAMGKPEKCKGVAQQRYDGQEEGPEEQIEQRNQSDRCEC